jgi:hypothetical protein
MYELRADLIHRVIVLFHSHRSGQLSRVEELGLSDTLGEHLCGESVDHDVKGTRCKMGIEVKLQFLKPLADLNSVNKPRARKLIGIRLTHKRILRENC